MVCLDTTKRRHQRLGTEVLWERKVETQSRFRQNTPTQTRRAVTSEHFNTPPVFKNVGRLLRLHNKLKSSRLFRDLHLNKQGKKPPLTWMGCHV